MGELRDELTGASFDYAGDVAVLRGRTLAGLLPIERVIAADPGTRVAFVAMLFPWAFRRLGVDPAFGSGPLATVVQDLLSITVYLLIATEIVD